MEGRQKFAITNEEYKSCVSLVESVVAAYPSEKLKSFIWMKLEESVNFNDLINKIQMALKRFKENNSWLDQMINKFHVEKSLKNRESTSTDAVTLLKYLAQLKIVPPHTVPTYEQHKLIPLFKKGLVKFIEEQKSAKNDPKQAHDGLTRYNSSLKQFIQRKTLNWPLVKGQIHLHDVYFPSWHACEQKQWCGFVKTARYWRATALQHLYSERWLQQLKSLNVVCNSVWRAVREVRTPKFVLLTSDSLA